MDEIRSFIVKNAPNKDQITSALQILDVLYLILATEDYSLVPHVQEPPVGFKKALSAFSRDQKSDVISVPVEKIGWLDQDWASDTGELLGKQLLSRLIMIPGYDAWEHVWGNQPYVAELTDLVMASNNCVGLKPEEYRRLQYAVDQNLYYFLGFCLGSAAVGSRKLFGPMVHVCRHLPFGIPLGRCKTNIWQGWLIAGR